MIGSIVGKMYGRRMLRRAMMMNEAPEGRGIVAAAGCRWLTGCPHLGHI